MQLRHVFGAETRGTKAVFNLSPLLTSLDGPIIACSDRFWAIPWVGGGGPVYVSPMSESGKVSARGLALLCVIRAVQEYKPINSAFINQHSLCTE